MSHKHVWLLNLGIEPYEKMHRLQLELVDWRQRGLIEDTLLLLEHAPVITLGRRAHEGHILASQDALDREGIDVCRIERGGDVTYHGPGQLVGYPIIHLPSYGMGASDYMHHLENVIARTCADYGLQTHCREKIIGLWVGENKIAALGVRIRRGVAFHGFALNVAPNIHHWGFIIPCGITDGGVTSLAREMPTCPLMSAVRERIATHFAEIFQVELIPTTLDALSQSVQQRSAIFAGDLSDQGRGLARIPGEKR